MGTFIVKLHDYDVEWSTVVDAPVTFGVKRDEFLAYYREQYGKVGMEELPQRLERVEKYGTSSWDRETPEDLFICNRAGPDEKKLTVSEIYRAYCLRVPIRKGWVAPEADGYP